MTPLVSVIIPVYNGEAVIADTLRSVMSQTFTDYELIVVNDGSTDQTETIVRNICPNAIIISQPNCGLAATRNHGTAVARGKWLAFVDADDLWHRTRLESLVKFVQENPDCHAVATTAKKFCLEDDLPKINAIGDWVDLTVQPGELQRKLIEEVIANEPLKMDRKLSYMDLLRGNCILSTSILIEKNLLMRAGMFPMHLCVSEDYFTWVNVAQLSAIWFVKSPTFYYRVHPKSMSRTNDLMVPQLGHYMSHWYSGRRKVRTNAEDAAALAVAGNGYKEWQFVELITKAVRAGDFWRVRAALHFGFFLLPQRRQRWELRKMVVKEYIKKYLMPWKYPKGAQTPDSLSLRERAGVRARSESEGVVLRGAPSPTPLPMGEGTEVAASAN